MDILFIYLFIYLFIVCLLVYFFFVVVTFSLQLQLEVAIQDAFLQFMATILKGYQWVIIVLLFLIVRFGEMLLYHYHYALIFSSIQTSRLFNDIFSVSTLV